MLYHIEKVYQNNLNPNLQEAYQIRKLNVKNNDECTLGIQMNNHLVYAC